MLNPSGVTINPQRYRGNDDDADWDSADWDDLAPIANAVPALGMPAAEASDGGIPYSQGGSIFVPRGSDLKNGDRFMLGGKRFGVVGDAMWDMNQPFTGADFGYVEYAIDYAVRLRVQG